MKHCQDCGAPLREELVDGERRFSCAACGGFHYENPVPVVAAVAAVGGRLVLVKRKVPPCAGEWALPSGFIRIGEMPEETVVREFLEETGFQGKAARLLGIYGETGRRYKWVLTIVYVVEVTGGVARAGDDAEDVGLFASKELPPIPFSSQREALAKYIREALPKGAFSD